MLQRNNFRRKNEENPLILCLGLHSVTCRAQKGFLLSGDAQCGNIFTSLYLNAMFGLFHFSEFCGVFFKYPVDT